MRRFYVPAALWGARIPLPEAARHHALHVLRMKSGDEILLFDGQGSSARARLEVLERVAWGIPLEPPQTQGAGLHLVLGQGMPRAEKLEQVLQHGTELGMSQYYPLQLERCVSKPGVDKEARKLERWQRIVVDAAKQCRRADLPGLSPPVDLERFLADFFQAGPAAVGLVPYEEHAGCRSLREVLLELGGLPEGGIWVLIGPEGGLTRQEVERARAARFVPVSLGPRILRTETAALATLAMLQLTLEPLLAART